MIEYEETTSPDVCGFLSDGRRVYRFGGRRMVMTKEAHLAALNAAFEAKKEEKFTTVGQSVNCAQVIDGQLCGGSLTRTAVCPRCSLGKQGVAMTLTCDVCGAVIAIIRGSK